MSGSAITYVTLGGRSVRVSDMERYMGMGVSLRSLRSLVKQLFCSSSWRYHADSIDCKASIGVRFNIIRKEKESRLYRAQVKSMKARKVCKFGEQ